jgi:hypothetical protein
MTCLVVASARVGEVQCHRRPSSLRRRTTVRAAARAEAAGIKVVMDRCPKIEYARLSGEIGWNGVNSRVISSKKPIMRKGFQSFGIRQR